jgi:general stress protein 26
MSTSTEPQTEVDTRYGEPDAGPTSWVDTLGVLESAELFWLTTVRPDGQPHVTPLIAVWHDGALHFCTGGHERKARNLEHNRGVVLTTGSNSWADGLDVVVEGAAEHVRDDDTLRALAAAWEAKYGSDWHFDVVDGAFASPGGATGTAIVFRVAPTTVFAFGKSPHSQTRHRF